MIEAPVSELESRARPHHQPGAAGSGAANALNLLPLSAKMTDMAGPAAGSTWE